MDKAIRPALLFLMLTLSLTIRPGSLSAQTTVTLGSGTSTSTSSPINTCYNYTYGQVIYTGTEIAAAGGSAGSITTLRFWYNSGGTTVSNWNNWTIYMGNTLKSSYASTSDWETLGNMTQVFSGAITTVAGNWITITLNTPFTYTGGNLVVAIDENVAGYSCTAAWRTYSYTGGARMSLSYYSDSTNPNPGSPPAASTSSTTAKPQAQFVIQSLSPCTGTPTPGNTLSTSNTVCANTSFNLSTQNNTTGSGVSYQWQSSSDNSTWTDISGATASTRSQTQTAATYYRCNVICSGNGTGTSTPLYVDINPFYNCYCASAATTTSDEEIFNVTLGTLNNSSNCSTVGPGPGSVNSMYSNYRGFVSPPILYTNSTVPFSIDANTCGGNYGNQVAMYIDYNRNGVFTDAGEQVYLGGTVTGPAIRSGIISIPGGASNGLTGMRVIQIEGTITGPCMSYSWGEVEDYLVDIQTPPACTATPTPGNTLASANTVCSGVSVTLSLQNSTIGTGVSYQWQSSSDNSTWTDVIGATTASLVRTHVASIYYRCNVTCSGNGTGTSTPVFVLLNDFQNCYCTSTATSTSDEEIFNVTLTGTTLNNTSNCSTVAPGPGSVNSMYSNYMTSVPAPVIYKTTTINFSVDANTCGGSYSNRMSIFIDYNQNGSFTDPGEEVHTGGTLSGANTRTGSFIIPGGAATGQTRMRVIQVETSSTIVPCGTYSWGETEDYLVDIQPLIPPNCATQTTPTDNSTGACFNGNGTTLAWTAPTGGGPVSGYKLYFGTDNPPTNIVNGSNIGNVLTTVSGALSASTVYYWKIVPTGLGGDGNCTTVFTFTTDANACVPPNCSAGYTAPASNAPFLDPASVALTWLAPIGGTPPTGYKVYLGTDYPPSNVINGTNVGNVLTTNATALTGNTKYYWQIVPTNATGDAIGCTLIDSFTTRPIYCTSNATSTADEFLANVTLGSLNNTSICGTLAPGPGSIANRYSNYTGLTPPNGDVRLEYFFLCLQWKLWRELHE